VRDATARGATPLSMTPYSITANKYIFRGAETEPILIDAAEGMLTYEGSATALRAGNAAEKNRSLAALKALVGAEAASLYAQTWNGAVRSALADSERISRKLAGVGLSQDWAAAAARAPTSSSTVKQFMQASLIIASHAALEAERDVLLVEMDGFDTHSDVLETTEAKFQTMDLAFDTFVREMKAIGMWDKVTLVGISDFGRTLTTNGKGTDHAWGGNYFLFGGDVRGGLIHGTFPELRVDGPDSISSTGQMLPTTPWEGLWRPLAVWFGVDESRMVEVLPNVHQFPPTMLLNMSSVFKSAAAEALMTAPEGSVVVPVASQDIPGRALNHSTRIALIVLLLVLSLAFAAALIHIWRHQRFPCTKRCAELYDERVTSRKSKSRVGPSPPNAT